MKDTLSATSMLQSVLVKVRPVLPEDAGRLRNMLARLSPETIYTRFHTPRAPEWAPEYLVNVRDRDGFALVAVVGGQVVGHAMYGKPVDGEAEIAVFVEDEWQANGVGKLLVAGLVEEAGSRGVEFFTCVSLGENRKVSLFVNTMFAEAECFVEGGTRLVRMPLRSISPAGELWKGQSTDG